MEAYGHFLSSESSLEAKHPLDDDTTTENISSVLKVLTRMRNNNPILITNHPPQAAATVTGLARWMARGRVPYLLRNVRVFELDAPSLAADANDLSDCEQRLLTVLQEAKEASPRVVVYIPKLAQLLTTFGYVLKPLLLRREVCCMGAATEDEYRAIVEPTRLFAPVHLTASPQAPREVLSAQIQGEDAAIQAVLTAMRRQPSRPSRKRRGCKGSFLFVGRESESGLEPPELQRQLSGNGELAEDDFLHIDLSEYSDETAASRLLGDAQHEQGVLTDAVRKHPASVVLFEEVEKAHARVQSILSQLLDKGELLDGAGEAVDFSETVLVMKSNLGAEELPDKGDRVEDILESAHEKALTAVRAHFADSFVDRLDSVCLFNPLTRGGLFGLDFDREFDREFHFDADRVDDDDYLGGLLPVKRRRRGSLPAPSDADWPFGGVGGGMFSGLGRWKFDQGYKFFTV